MMWPFRKNSYRAWDIGIFVGLIASVLVRGYLRDGTLTGQTLLYALAVVTIVAGVYLYLHTFFPRAAPPPPPPHRDDER
jgi:uncharacterized membrane protein YobD (UPF0266 family)